MICLIFTTQINPTCGTYVLQSARAFPLNPFFDFFKKISRDSVFTHLEVYNGFPQINILFKFSRINHRPLVIINGFNKCCEINTFSLPYGSLQVLSWNNDSEKWLYHRKMDDWKWSSYNRLLLRYASLKSRMC